MFLKGKGLTIRGFDAFVLRKAMKNPEIFL